MGSASTLARLYSSTFYALRDTRTPLRYAIVRVSITTVLGYLCAIPLPHLLGIDSSWGAAGLTASAGVAGWCEMLLLRRTLRHRIGTTGIHTGMLLSLWGSALAGAAIGWGVKLVLPAVHPAIEPARRGEDRIADRLGLHPPGRVVREQAILGIKVRRTNPTR